MAAAALVVSVLALLASVFVGLRQASADRRVAEIETARRQDELRPTLRAHWRQDGSDYWLKLTNLGPSPIVKATWSFQIDQAVHPLVGLGPLSRQADELQMGLEVGESTTLAAHVDRQGPARGPVTLTIDAEGLGHQWMLTTEFEAVRHSGSDVWRRS